MALIRCPECGKEVSDKAQKCVYCGKVLIEEELTKQEIKCTECGAILSETDSICPNCGCPIDNNRYRYKNVDRNSKRNFIIISLIVICIIIGISFFSQRNHIPDGYTKEYYLEAEIFVKDCEKFLKNPTDENYPELGNIFEDVNENMFDYTSKDWILSEQQLTTETTAFYYSIGICTENEFLDEINKMKELMEMD